MSITEKLQFIFMLISLEYVNEMSVTWPPVASFGTVTAASEHDDHKLRTQLLSFDSFFSLSSISYIPYVIYKCYNAFMPYIRLP